MEEVNSPDWIPCQKLGYNIGQSIKRKSALDRYNRYKRRVINVIFNQFNLKLIIIIGLFQVKENDPPIAKAANLINSVDDNQFNVINNEFVEEENNYVEVDNCKSTQTDMTMEDLCSFMEKLDISTSENDKLLQKLTKLDLDEDSFRGDDKKTRYFTGLTNFKMLKALDKIVSPHLSKSSASLPSFKQLLLTLMKLRLDLPFQYLSYRWCFFSLFSY